MTSFKGRLITTTPIVTTGVKNGVANGIWTVSDALLLKLTSSWPLPPTVTNAPTGVVALVGNTQATVSFTAPTDTGGIPVTSYTVTSSGGQTATGASSPITVTGLTNGTSYTFTVTATNNVGVSSSSIASNSGYFVNGDPFFSSVGLLLNGDGTASSTVFADLSVVPKTVSITGTVTVNTGTKQFGTGSIYVPSGSNYLSIPSAAGDSTDITSGDFTIECWINKPTSSTVGFLHKFTTSGTARSWFFGQDGSGAVYFYGSTSGSAWEVAIGTGSIPANTWTHVAAVRYGNVIKIFINGVQSGSDYAFSGTFYNSATPIYIGNNSGAPTSWSINGYMDDVRITKGIARYKTNFTPPTTAFVAVGLAQADPYYSSVSLLVSGDGANGSQAFTDTSSIPKTITTYGNTQVSTSVVKYGSGSMYFDGNGDYLSTPASAAFAFGTGSFTIEMWYYPVSVTSSWPFMWSNGNGYPTNCISINDRHAQHNTVFSVTLGNYQPSNDTALNGTTVVANNRWYHLALVRNGTTISLYVNGVSEASITYSGSLDGGTSEASIIGGSTSAYCNGYIDDLRITKGVARYIGNFTPPVAAHQASNTNSATSIDPAFSAVSLLLTGDGTAGSTTFTDASSSPKTITRYGNTQVSTTTKKYGTGSIYLDGNGDYLTVPSTEPFSFGTADFTIECWIWQNTPYNSWPFIVDIGEHIGGPGICVISGGGAGSDSPAPNMLSVYSQGWYNSTSNISASNEWIHIAVVRANNRLIFFKNGVASSSLAYSNNINLSTSGIIGIGGCVNGPYALATNRNFTGYIDDLRITKGLARYISDFVPPTQALPVA
jgi:hypothetical protein